MLGWRSSYWASPRAGPIVRLRRIRLGAHARRNLAEEAPKDMQLRSLGYRTDLIFAGFDGEIIDRGEYLVIRTPSNPGYYWGNFLLFQDPPQADDLARWRRLFKQEVGGPPKCNHQTFGWDADQAGDTRAFLDTGFRLNRNSVMTCASPRSPEQAAAGVEIRPLQTASEVQAAVENQVVCREPGHDEASFRIFRERQMARYGAMSRAGLGDWYGAFVNGRLVADLGLFIDEEIGRYQSVETNPRFRRKGIAGTMVFEAGRQAIAKYNLQTLVIVADDGSAAARLYASVGFRAIETQWGLEWWPGARP